MKVPQNPTIRVLAIIGFLSLLAGCGGTYVDDKHNFERAFNAKCPTDLQVVRSVYTQTPHFTEEHEYYFELLATNGPIVPKWLTNRTDIIAATNGFQEIPISFGLRADRPKWFVPKQSASYDVWYCTNDTFVVLRDRRESKIFVYGSVGM